MVLTIVIVSFHVNLHDQDNIPIGQYPQADLSRQSLIEASFPG